MRNHLLLFILLLFVGCNKKPTITKQEKNRFYQLLNTGNYIYAQRSSLKNFEMSMRYFDSAVTIAEKYNNDTLKKSAYACIARAYDAWNKEPQKTIYYFEKAIHFAELVNDTIGFVLWRVNLADSYNKANDSINAIKTINKCNALSALADSLDEYDDFYTELAYIAACAKNYPLSSSLFQKVRKPENIVNYEINFRFHQTFTQCMLHVYYLHSDIKPWLDSIKTNVTQSANLSDSLYHYQFLIMCYEYLHEKDSVAKYIQIAKKADNKFGDKLDESKAKNAFLEYQIKESERIKTISDLEKTSLVNTSIAIAIIAILSALITLLAFLNRKKLATKNKALAELNNQLKSKADENELLLKEMHHRVKNNLSLVYSLLEMQGRNTENEETRSQLMIAKGRIESIAMTHEQLYKNQNELLNMHDYLTIIINSIIHSCGATKQIHPTIDIEKSLELKPEKCLPLAMLINEMITNSAKYAITNEDCIYIRINGGIENNIITILYADSGEINIDSDFKEGFGSKIIKILSKQLHANLETNFNNIPFNYCLKFTA